MTKDGTVGPPPNDETQPGRHEGRTTAEEVGRKTAGWLKAAGPKLGQFVEQNRPRVEKAGREAVDYVKAHEGELKQTAARLARARFRGPLGLVVDGLSSPPQTKGANDVTCEACSFSNPAGSRYCNQCGTALHGLDGRPNAGRAPNG